jgi:hypothetical protein
MSLDLPGFLSYQTSFFDDEADLKRGDFSGKGLTGSEH